MKKLKYKKYIFLFDYPIILNLSSLREEQNLKCLVVRVTSISTGVV